MVTIQTRNRKKALITTNRGAYESNKKNFDRTRLLRNSAIKELQKPETVYILGDKVTYIHSTEAYFKSGLQTATAEMSLMLDRLFVSQKRVIKDSIAYINNQWKIKLEPFGLKSFEEYNNLLKRSLQDMGDEHSYFAAIESLKKAKIAKIKLDQIHSLIHESKLKNGTVEENQSRIQESLDKAGIAMVVGIEYDPQGNFKNYSYSKGDKDIFNSERYWQKQFIDALQEVLRQNSGRLNQIKKALNDKQIEAIQKGNITASSSITHTDLGNLFEMATNKAFATIEEDGTILEHGLFIVNQALEKANKGKAKQRNTIKTTAKSSSRNKEDSRVFHVINGKILSFTTSDKTGEIIDHAIKQIDPHVLNTVERFTASLESSALNLSTFDVGNKVHQIQKEKVDQLIQYVLRNKGAFNTQVNIKDFQELVVLYLAWLKIVVGIIGNPEDKEQIPLAIRTLNGFTNTAEVLEYFVNMQKATDIKKYINFSKIKDHFYKINDSVVIDKNDKINLYNAKKNELSVIPSNSSVSYPWLKNKIENQLSSLKTNSGKLKGIDTTFSIELHNLTRRL